MFACWMCTINDARSTTTIAWAFVGVFLAFAVFLTPLRRTRHVRRRDTRQPIICDVAGLSVLLTPAGLLILTGVPSKPTIQIAPLAAILIATVFYVWLRCRQLLDSNNIRRKRERFLFVGVALPCIFIAGFLVGDWAILLPIAIGSDFLVDYTTSAAITILVASSAAFLSLCTVFPDVYRLPAARV